MGCCASRDASPKYFLESLRALNNNNLDLLKGLTFKFIEEGDHAIAVRLINIRCITQKYYRRLEQEKSSFFDPTLTDEEKTETGFQLLAKERKQAAKANTQLSRAFLSFKNTSLFFTVSSVKSYLETVQENERALHTYKTLKQKVKQCIHRGRGVETLAQALSQGKPISDEASRKLLMICKYTSHLATNRRRRVSYETSGRARSVTSVDHHAQTEFLLEDGQVSVAQHSLLLRRYESI